VQAIIKTSDPSLQATSMANSPIGKGSGNKEREKKQVIILFFFLKGASDYSWQSCREEAEQQGVLDDQ